MEEDELDQQLACNIIEQLTDENIDQIEITIVQADDDGSDAQHTIQINGHIQTTSDDIAAAQKSDVPMVSAHEAAYLRSEGPMVSAPEAAALRSEGPTVSGPGVGSSRKRGRKSIQGAGKKYRKEWEIVPEYESWLTESTVEGHAFCMACECDISVDKGKAQLTRHSMRRKHVENEKAMRRGEMNRRFRESQETSSGRAAGAVTLPDDDVVDLQERHRRVEKPLSVQTQSAEAELVAFIVENNLPLSLVDRLVCMIKDLPSVGNAIKKIHLGKQKATNMVRQGFAPFFKDILVDKLRNTLFSVVVEEAVDKTKNSKLVAIFVYFCNKDLKIEVDLLEVIECDDSPDTIYGKLKDCLKKIEHAGVPMTNWIGFRSDVSNGGGDCQSLSEKIREDSPWVVSIMCPVHMAKLAISSACKSLPSHLEDSLHVIHHHLSTPATQPLGNLEKLFKFDMEKILAPGQTQWLSVHSLVKHVVDQWQDLQLHFTKVVMEDSCNGNELVLEVLLNPMMRVMALFTEYILSITDDFCTMFQTEEPLIYNLERETRELICTLAKSFMAREFVDAQPDMMKLNPNEQTSHLPLPQVYLGHEATAALAMQMQQCKLTFEDSDVVFALTCAQECYKVLIIQIQSRFDFSHSFYKFINIMNPVKAYNTDPPSLMEFFANFFHSEWSKRSMEDEWRSVCLLGLPNDDILLSPVEFWKFVLARKTPTGINRFQHLREILLFFLSFPYSKVAIDKMADLMKEVRANSRRYLKTVTLSACLRSHCGLRRVPDALDNPHLRKRLERVKSNAKSVDCDDMPILMAE